MPRARRRAARRDVRAVPRPSCAAYRAEERACHALRHRNGAAGAGAPGHVQPGRTHARADRDAEDPRLVRQEHRRARGGGAAAHAAVRTGAAARRAGAERAHLARGGAAIFGAGRAELLCDEYDDDRPPFPDDADDPARGQLPEMPPAQPAPAAPMETPGAA